MNDTVPSVTSQGFPARFIPHGEPEIRNYNSGLCLKNGDRFIATRRFDPERWRSEIMVKQLGDCVYKRRTLDLPRAHGRESHEDARLFWHGGKLHCAYTEGQYWMRPWVAVQKVAVLRDDWSVEQVHTIGFGENSIGQEKNWQFFSHEGQLHFVYSIRPHVVVEMDDQFRPTKTHTTPTDAPENLRGGTPPVRVGDYYVTFPHFHVAHKERSRRYGFSSLIFEAKPPFNIAFVSDPLIHASANDPTIPNLAYPHWNPIVVFPCGALYQEDGVWSVSAGINDSFDAIFEIPAHATTRRVPESPPEAL